MLEDHVIPFSLRTTVNLTIDEVTQICSIIDCDGFIHYLRMYGLDFSRFSSLPIAEQKNIRLHYVRCCLQVSFSDR